MSNSTQNITFNLSDNATCTINQSTESHSGFFYAVMWYLATIVLKLDLITNALAVTNNTQDKAMEEEVKTENLTASLNTDISGYLAGKNSFITGIVDLLLARMAKEERFSDDENSLDWFQPHDVIKMENDEFYSYAVYMSKYPRMPKYAHHIILEEGKWVHVASNPFINNTAYYIRTITELEAVEFRKAMEAVYG